MALVRKVMNRMEGKVGVESEEGVISLLRRQREAAQMHESENMMMSE